MYRGVITGCSSEFKELVKSLIAGKQNDDDVLVVSDGRSEVARKQIRSLFASLLGDDYFMELWIIYDMETSLKQDVRNPKRKVAWSSANVETLFVKLPPKRKQQLVARDTFNKCGESTNFCRSYSGVPFRNLDEIPRLSSEGKINILGTSAIGEFPADSRVHKYVALKGHPLFWGEWKPVALYSAILRDFQVADVVDVTPGSGAACLAAIKSDIFYIGLCVNEPQRDWLQDNIHRTLQRWSAA